MVNTIETEYYNNAACTIEDQMFAQVHLQSVNHSVGRHVQGATH